VELYFDCLIRLRDVFYKHELVFMQVLLNTGTTVRCTVLCVCVCVCVCVCSTDMTQENPGVPDTGWHSK